MTRLLEAGDVVLRDGVAVGRGGHDPRVRVDGLRVGEAAGIESRVVDPQVLATLVWLPRGAVVRVSGEGGRCWEGREYEGDGYELRWIYASDPHFVGRPEGRRLSSLPPTLGIPAPEQNGSIVPEARYSSRSPVARPDL